MFLEKGPRSFNEYLAVSAQLRGDESFQDYQGLVNWMRLNTPADAEFVSAGFSENRIMELPYLTRRSVTTLNVYRYRGGMHFMKGEFDKKIHYFEELLGVSWKKMGAADGRLTGLQRIVEDMDEEHIRNMSLPHGHKFDYFITRYSLDLEFPIAYRGGDIVAYKITHPH